MTETAAVKKLWPGRIWNLRGEDYIIPPLGNRAIARAQDRTLEQFLELRPMLDEIERTSKLLSESGEDKMDTEAMQSAVVNSKRAAAIQMEADCVIAFEAFALNYPAIAYDDFCDMCSLYQMKEIAAWVVIGDMSAKKN